jgi:signal transduction histidine kinase
MTTPFGPRADASPEELEMRARLITADRWSALGTIAAGLAHEINNPLVCVLAGLGSVASELRKLEAGPACPDLPARLRALRETLEGALEAGQQIRQLVKELGSQAADDERSRIFDLHPVLDAALRLVAPQLSHRTRIVKEYGTVPWVEANEVKLGQVFLNLLLNAVQAIAEGAHTRDHAVRVVTAPDGLGRVVVAIHDTGPGVAPEALGRVFEPCFTTKTTGTGLGLFICKEIIDGLGGEIQVETSPGRGTVLRVILPAARIRPSRPGRGSRPRQDPGRDQASLAPAPQSPR